MKIMIVGEAWGERESELGEPFVGPSGQVLNTMLRTVGINRDECYLTNVFNFQPPGNKLDNLGGPKTDAITGWPRLANNLYINNRYKPELDRLMLEIEQVNPTLIIALGATPLWAICKQMGIKKFRGTPILAADGKHKVLPTYHPAAIMRQWKLRPIVIRDLAKARKEAEFAEIRRPQRFIHMPESIEDLWDFHERYIKDAEVVSADIETKQLSITEIGFAPLEDRALVVPFYSRDIRGGNFWPTHKEEFAAWKFVEHVCATKPLVGQNFSYDIQYLWAKNRIACMTVADDTMILHHAMYPEMEKSLGFLGSIYTNEPSWKFMRTDHDNFKAED